MKKLVFWGIILFIISASLGFVLSRNYIEKNIASEDLYQNLIDNTVASNVIELKTIEASYESEKVTPSTEFAIKEYYDECNHFNFQYAELPTELINMTVQEIEDYYDDYEVEEFKNNSLVLAREINGICDNHYCIGLENDMVIVYKVNTDMSLSLYKNTGISKDYLAEEDIEKLEEGIYVYGESKVNSTIEDFE